MKGWHLIYEDGLHSLITLCIIRYENVLGYLQQHSLM